VPLVKAGLVKGEFDTDGFLEYLDPADEKAGEELIRSAIKAL
jgi:hypothetical protein